MESGRQIGKVKWFDPVRGYGFITPDGGGRDLFVHHTQIEGQGFRTLQEGDQVAFEGGTGQKGPYACRVERMSA